MNTPTKLYVGCALTNAPEEFKQTVEDFKVSLREAGYEVFDFVGLVAGTARDVYDWDIQHCVGECDAFIGICDFPAIGLGFETSRALTLGKPVLLVAHKDTKVTRLILGAAEAEPTLTFERYTTLKDVLPLVDTLVKNI